MSKTSLKLPYVRFVRQVTTGPGANTQFVALMMEAVEQLKIAQWRQSAADLDKIAMPFNAPLTFVPEDRYDAYKASKTESGSGVQECNVGMAAYRFKIPAAASTIPVAAISAVIGADKFAYSGVKVAVICSDSATPPLDWDLLRKGGQGDVVDVTNTFATYLDMPETYGVLNSRAHANVGDASNQADLFTLNLAAVTGTYSYLYVVVSMFDYEDYRPQRQYWIEGAGILNGASTEVTFDTENAIEADPDVLSSISAGLRLAGARQTAVFKAPVSNLTDGYIHRHWAAAMLRRGRVAVSVADPSLIEDAAAILSASVTSDGATVTAQGSILPLYVPAAAVRDGFCWISVSAVQTGVSPVRVSLFSAAPDPTKSDTWSGAGVACVGSVLIAGATGYEVIGIPLRRAVNGDLWAVCCVADVLPADATSAIGWGNAHGLDFTDAHIARERYATAAAPEWVAYSGDGTAGLMLPLLRGTAAVPAHFALSADGAIYRSRTSYAAWAIDPVAGANLWQVAAAGTYVAVLAGPPAPASTNVGFAGTVSSSILSGVAALVADAENEIVFIAALPNLFVVLYFDTGDSTMKLAVEGALSVLLTRVAGWNPEEITALTAGGDILCARFADASARIDGAGTALAAAAVTAVDALTSVAEIRASSTHVIARHTDGTCTAVVNATQANPAAGVDVSAWTGVVAVAAAKDCVFGLQADGTLLRSGITTWLDFTAVDARGCSMVIGSGYARAAFKLIPSA